MSLVEPAGPTVVQLVVNVAAAAVVAAVLGEALWLRVTVGRARVARLGVAAAMTAGALVTSAGLSVLDASVWPALRRLPPDGWVGLWDRHPVLAAVVAFVVWDATGYVYHWIGHGTQLGWASHRVHHTGDAYDMTLAWRQSWLPFPAVLVFWPVALLGFDLTTVVICASVSKLWQTLVHTDAPVPIPTWLAAVCTTPGTHRRHHTVDGGGVNLGPVLTVWDRLAGTWDPSPVAPDASYGIAGASDVDGVVQIELAGWRAWVHDRRERRRSEQRRATRRRPDQAAPCSWQLTHCTAVGKASSRSAGIDSSQDAQVP